MDRLGIIDTKPAIRKEATERRRAVRRKWNRLARISGNDTIFLDCIVKDISRTGARLLLSSDTWTFSQFDVQFLDPFVIRRVELVWKKGSMIGVKFC